MICKSPMPASRPRHLSLIIDVRATHDDTARNSRVVLAVSMASLASILLFSAKLLAFIVSGSQSVLASLAESGLSSGLSA